MSRLIKFLIQLAFASALIALLVSCGGGALDGLSDAEKAFVIPDSSKWGEGNPCDPGDCGGDLTVRTMQVFCWAEIDPTSWSYESGVDGEPDVGEIFMEIQDTLRGPPDDVIIGRTWGNTARQMTRAAEEGMRLLVSHDCADSPRDGLVEYVIAVDEAGRIAGIGFGAARFTTAPIARAAAASSATTGEEYVLSVLQGDTES